MTKGYRVTVPWHFPMTDPKSSRADLRKHKNVLLLQKLKEIADLLFFPSDKGIIKDSWITAVLKAFKRLSPPGKLAYVYDSTVANSWIWLVRGWWEMFCFFYSDGDDLDCKHFNISADPSTALWNTFHLGSCFPDPIGIAETCFDLNHTEVKVVAILSC